MWFNATLHSKRNDDQPFELGGFIPHVTYARRFAKHAIESTREQKVSNNAENIERLAKATGMESGDLSESEYQKIVDAERDRVSRIPK